MTRLMCYHAEIGRSTSEVWAHVAGTTKTGAHWGPTLGTVACFAPYKQAPPPRRLLRPIWSQLVKQ